MQEGEADRARSSGMEIFFFKSGSTVLVLSLQPGRRRIRAAAAADDAPIKTKPFFIFHFTDLRRNHPPEESFARPHWPGPPSGARSVTCPGQSHVALQINDRPATHAEGILISNGGHSCRAFGQGSGGE